jgi:hypothetical protein
MGDLFSDAEATLIWPGLTRIYTASPPSDDRDFATGSLLDDKLIEKITKSEKWRKRSK